MSEVLVASRSAVSCDAMYLIHCMLLKVFEGFESFAIAIDWWSLCHLNDQKHCGICKFSTTRIREPRTEAYDRTEQYMITKGLTSLLIKCKMVKLLLSYPLPSTSRPRQSARKLPHMSIFHQFTQWISADRFFKIVRTHHALSGQRQYREKVAVQCALVVKASAFTPLVASRSSRGFSHRS
jgi:hypothetical protein